MAITQEDDGGAYSVKQFCGRYAVGVTFVYAQIKAGKLRARKASGRTLILKSDARAWAEGLPQLRTGRAAA